MPSPEVSVALSPAQDLALETTCYVMVFGLFYATVTFLLLAPLLIPGIRARVPKWLGHLWLYAGLFPAALLVASTAGDALWYAHVHGVRYHSVDYFADFNPFFKMSQGALTYTWPGQPPGGPINGATFEEIYALWGQLASWCRQTAVCLWLAMCLVLSPLVARIVRAMRPLIPPPLPNG